MNSCTFTGRVVFDAEMRTTASGTSLCRLRIASDTGWGDNEKTHWLDCVIFGNRGDALQRHLTKGTQVTVVGDLAPPRTYESKSGETRVAQDLVVREIALQGGSKDHGATASVASSSTPAAEADFGDDVPF